MRANLSERARRRRRTQNGVRAGAALVVVLLIGGLWLEGRPEARPEVVTEVALDVAGLHCPIWCPVKVDRALAGAPGVFELEVDVESGQVHATIDPQRTSAAELAGRLEAAGWDVSTTQR